MESLKLASKVVLKKYSREQTNQAAAHHGIEPKEIQAHHFDNLSMEPEETLHVDYQSDLVEHHTADQVRRYTLEEWNQNGNK